MDVDERESVFSERVPKSETVFATSEELTASFYANLPAEVKQSLKNAGEFISSFSRLLRLNTCARKTFTASSTLAKLTQQLVLPLSLPCKHVSCGSMPR
jgi:hypothetical protein